MKVFVGVTDEKWYRFLAARPDLNEVNFWRPSGGAFRALTPGEPFFFKAHYPLNRVVGGGFFSGFTQLKISEAWNLFGEGNGVASLDEMRRSVGRYRKQPIEPGEDPVIGCIFVRDSVFFPDGSTVDPPPGFAPNVVQGKTYDLADPAAADYFGLALHRLLGGDVELDLREPWHRPGPVYGDPRLVPQRLGQKSFKAVVLGAYGRRCAITGNKLQPVLQAAHIRPLPAGGEHRIDNGMLLRSDVHILFDQGYLGVDPRYRLMVSPRLRSEFGNGDQFYAKAGSVIAIPERRGDRPKAEFLEWHLESVFKAA
ncbi:HNH endonuclease [Micromonospora sp. C28ISP2-4]|uniref:HNH endonuclease n=1 Tax=Micromonospora sp. C28ISP2-4 TaxID=3059523 RepID=UPI002676930D|nr:HNH endonuclease [Micromonospora sp. C28ISP2-4]MDO3685390.1 HNH endonuclease [Micromonospora sp. C28ISP2-4]